MTALRIDGNVERMENGAGYRIAAVKRPETRARRIAEFVAMLERGETIHG